MFLFLAGSAVRTVSNYCDFMHSSFQMAVVTCIAGQWASSFVVGWFGFLFFGGVFCPS